VEVNVIHNLMSNTSVVLQDIVVLSIHRLSNLLCDGQDLGELVVGDIVEFCAVVFGNDELWRGWLEEMQEEGGAGELTA
jgi:hypothetical protein